MLQYGILQQYFLAQLLRLFAENKILLYVKSADSIYQKARYKLATT